MSANANVGLIMCAALLRPHMFSSIRRYENARTEQLLLSPLTDVALSLLTCGFFFSARACVRTCVCLSGSICVTVVTRESIDRALVNRSVRVSVCVSQSTLTVVI